MIGFFIAANAQKQFELDGVIVPRTIQFQNQDLQLNGYGTRSKFLIDVYVQALYLENFFPEAKDILNSDSNMAIRIQVLSSLVTSKKFSKALYKGLVKSVGEEGVKQFIIQSTQLEDLLTKEDIVKNDAFNLIYNRIDKTIWIYKNDILQGKIEGFEF
jgi:hypothetical protein